MSDSSEALHREPHTQNTYTVRDVMDKRFARFKPDMPMEEAVSIIISNNTPGGPVLDSQGKLVGFLSERDCLRMAMDSRYHNFDSGDVEKFMRTEVLTVPESMSLFDAVSQFINHWVHVYPVVDANEVVVGLIRRKAVLETVHKLPATTW